HDDDASLLATRGRIHLDAVREHRARKRRKRVELLRDTFEQLAQLRRGAFHDRVGIGTVLKRVVGHHGTPSAEPIIWDRRARAVAGLSSRAMWVSLTRTEAPSRMQATRQQILDFLPAQRG